MLCTLCKHGLESHLVHHLSDSIRIDELRVAESLRCHSEIVLDGFLMLKHLMLELSLGSKSCKRVVIGLRKELHMTCLSELTEAFQHLRSISVELLEDSTGDGECHLERTLVRFNKLEEEGIHREIALLCNPAEDGPVGEIIVVVRILSDVKESV